MSLTELFSSNHGFCSYGMSILPETATMLLFLEYFLLATPAVAKPIDYGDRSGTRDHAVARARRDNTGDDIPLDKRVACRHVGFCDSRVEFCDEDGPMPKCGSCEGDVCNPERYAVGDNAEGDCKFHCPEFWQKQHGLVISTTTTTTTLRSPTAVPTAVSNVTTKNDEPTQTRSSTTIVHYLPVVAFVACFIILLAMVIILIFACRHKISIMLFGPRPRETPPKVIYQTAKVYGQPTDSGASQFNDHLLGNTAETNV